MPYLFLSSILQEEKEALNLSKLSWNFYNQDQDKEIKRAKYHGELMAAKGQPD